jgi:hypothetical protein
MEENNTKGHVPTQIIAMVFNIYHLVAKGAMAKKSMVQDYISMRPENTDNGLPSFVAGEKQLLSCLRLAN